MQIFAVDNQKINAELVYLNDVKLPYSAIINIHNDEAVNKKYNVKLIHVESGQEVESKDIVCSQKLCEKKFELRSQIFYGEYQIKITSLSEDLEKTLKFNLEKKQVINVKMPESFEYTAGKSLKISGIIMTNYTKKLYLEIQPDNLPKFREKQVLVCTKRCKFSFTLRRNIFETNYTLKINTLQEHFEKKFKIKFNMSQKEIRENTRIKKNTSGLPEQIVPHQIKTPEDIRINTLLGIQSEEIPASFNKNSINYKPEKLIEFELKNNLKIESFTEGEKGNYTIRKGKNKIRFKNTNISKIKVLNFITPSNTSYLTDIVHAEINNLTLATVTLQKKGPISKILKCNNFSGDSCFSGWEDSGLKFNQNRKEVWFSPDHFSAYVGVGPGFNFSVTIVSPTTPGAVSIIANQTQKIDVNVTCLSGTCGNLNISLNLLYPQSCKEIHDLMPSSASGVYSIDPDGLGGATPVDAYCEMNQSGGGWTLLFQRRSDSTNTQSCGSNFNGFLHNTCGDVNTLGYTDSYSFDTTNTLAHDQYLVIQYDSGLVADDDDAYIINTTSDVFPNNAGIVNTGVSALCDVNETNCDTTSATIRYRGSGGYMSACNGQVTNAAYQGHFGACPNGIVAGSLSAQFGNRNQWAETKLWGFGGGSDIFMERVFTREATDYTSQDRILSNVSGTTPFWVNISNPTNYTLGVGQSTLVSFYVNASGLVGDTYVLYASVIIANNSLIKGQSDNLNVTIADNSPPIANKTNPVNDTTLNSKILTFNVSATDDSGLDSATIYIWNSTGDLIYTDTNNIFGTSNSTSWTREFSQNGNFTWNVLVKDIGLNSVWADNNTNFTFSLTFPIYSIDLYNTSTSITAIKNKFFNFGVNITCVSGNCSSTNVSLNIYYPQSCKEIHDLMPSSASGVYSIDPDGLGGSAPVDAYCEMNQSGGGWTLLFQRRSDSTNTQSCGTNFNGFLHNTCGDVNTLGYTDSYSFDTTNTLAHDQYLVIQYDSGLVADVDDAYIINTTSDVFPNNAGVVNTGVSALCDVNETNCDTTSATIRYRGSGGYMWACNAQANSGSFQGHFGACPNGIVAGPLSAQFGNRNQWAETKLWGYGGGSDIFMERVFTREATDYTSQDKILSTVSGTTPFWVNGTNEKSISISSGNSQIFTWLANATGGVSEMYQLYGLVFTLDDLTIRNKTTVVNVTIGDDTPPVANKILPVNNTTINATSITFNVTSLDDSGLEDITLYIWNSTNSIIYNNTVNLNSVMSANTSWSVNLTQNGTYKWDALVRDIGLTSSWADNNTNFTFNLNLPIISVKLVNPLFNKTVLQNEFFPFTINVTCENKDCGNLNISLRTPETYVSCKEIHDLMPSSPSGVYSIDLDGLGGSAPVDAYCEMTQSGGGWTLLFQRRSDSTNTQSCGSNFNGFLHNACGDVNTLGYTDSYSFNVSDTLAHDQYLVIQYDSGLVADVDDAYIINTTSDVFPNNAGVVNTGVSALCDVNETNCDTTSATIRYRGSGGYMSACNGQVTNAAYQGHFGACPNGIIAGSLSAQFGNRNQWAETKLWGFGGGSDIFMERVFTREATTYTAWKGIVLNSSGSISFWTNSSNPIITNFNKGDSILLTWFVNATGQNNFSQEFFSKVSLVNDKNIQDLSKSVFITITNDSNIYANKTSPNNGSQINTSIVNFNATANNVVGLDRSYFVILDENNNTIYNTTTDLNGSTNVSLNWTYIFSNPGNYTWGVQFFDIYNNSIWANNYNFSLKINISKRITNYSVTINKKIESVFEKGYFVTIQVTNLNDSPQNVSVFDFVPANFVAYNFTPPFNLSNNINGIKYYGTIFYWNNTVINGFSNFNITYNINGTADYPLMKNYIVGLE